MSSCRSRSQLPSPLLYPSSSNIKLLPHPLAKSRMIREDEHHAREEEREEERGDEY